MKSMYAVHSRVSEAIKNLNSAKSHLPNYLAGTQGAQEREIVEGDLNDSLGLLHDILLNIEDYLDEVDEEE